jgi:hypothetical protein
MWIQSSTFEVWIYWTVIGLFFAVVIGLCIWAAMQ